MTEAETASHDHDDCATPEASVDELHSCESEALSRARTSIDGLSKAELNKQKRCVIDVLALMKEEGNKQPHVVANFETIRAHIEDRLREYDRQNASHISRRRLRPT